MILNDKELKKLHEVEIEIFKEFLSVCEKLNLRYFLLGGTCLGTIRHDGFIPWDDDIDVGMPRCDYEKFLNEGQKYLSKNLFIQTMKVDKNYRNHFAKIRKIDTTFIEESVKDVEMNQGIYIDIFPLDGIGNTIEEAKKRHYKYRKLNEIYIHKKGSHSKKGLKNILRYIYYSFLSLPYKNIFKIEEKIQEFCSECNYDESEYICNFFGMWREKEISDKNWFLNGEKKQFEKIEVIVPKDYDKYLTKMYGNYMELPPVSKRVAPHCYILDLNKSYKKYLKK